MVDENCCYMRGECKTRGEMSERWPFLLTFSLLIWSYNIAYSSKLRQWYIYLVSWFLSLFSIGRYSRSWYIVWQSEFWRPNSSVDKSQLFGIATACHCLCIGWHCSHWLWEGAHRYILLLSILISFSSLLAGNLNWNSFLHFICTGWRSSPDFYPMDCALQQLTRPLKTPCVFII